MYTFGTIIFGNLQTKIEPNPSNTQVGEENEQHIKNK
jgi:hypothetical protein